MDLDYAIFSVIAPMIFLILAKHSTGVCVQDPVEMNPQKFIAAQLSTLLHGLSASPADLPKTPKKARA